MSGCARRDAGRPAPPGAGRLDGERRARPGGTAAALEAATSGELDLLVVGGGITGAGAALDAATRGLHVALVEARDLASGASSASSKLIHGGLRYLEMGDFALVREALRERELLLTRLAPHLVAPVPFLWPLRGRVWERAYLGAGLALYDTLGGARSVPRHRHLGRRGALAVAPALRADALAGAVQFHDAAEDDARMVLAVARTAAAHGAHVATRVRVTGFRPGGEVEAVDAETGETLRLRARHVAAAAGAWTDRLRALAGGRSERRIVPSKGIHLFVARERIPMDTGVLARTEKSVLFVIPWQGGWLIGDTDTPWRAGPDDVVASRGDVDYLLAKANALLAAPLAREDVHGVTAGLRPLVAGTGAGDTTRISRRHVVESPIAGLTTIAGGKYTTYRVMAAALVDAVARALGSTAPSVTRDVPLLGGGRVDRAALAARAGVEHATVDALVRRHGDHARELVDLIAARPALAAPLEGGGGVLRGEVAYACTHEGALHVEDVIARRTRLAIVAPDRGLEAAGPAAAVMAEALGWPPGRAREEAEAWRARVAADRAAEAEPDDARALAAHRAVLAERPTRRWRRDERARPRPRPGHLQHALRGAGRRAARAGGVLDPRRLLLPRPGPGRAGPRRAGRLVRAGAGRRARGGGGAAGRRGRAGDGQPDGDVRRVGPRHGPPDPPRDRVAGPPHGRECAELGDHEALVRGRTGLELDATFPATKLAWVLDHVEGARAAAEDGRLAYGDVAAWLLQRLAGVHVSDAHNAGRSLLCGLESGDWDDELLALFGVPRALLPPVVDSDALDAEIGGVPVRAATGDQPASLFGLRCWEAGTAKVTLGTGAFVLAQAGGRPPSPPAGILASCAWRRAGAPSFELEGFIPTAGAAADWFARIGALPPGPALDPLLASGTPGVVCVPALQGLGSPGWEAGARGAVLGLSLGTTRADLAVAVIDGILHQVADAVDAMAPAVRLEALRIDGGLSRSDWITQRLADLSGVRVERTARADSTALGAAALAGLAAGVWSEPAALPAVPLDLVAEPSLAPAARTRGARPLGGGARGGDRLARAVRRPPARRLDRRPSDCRRLDRPRLDARRLDRPTVLTGRLS